MADNVILLITIKLGYMVQILEIIFVLSSLSVLDLILISTVQLGPSQYLYLNWLQNGTNNPLKP